MLPTVKAVYCGTFLTFWLARTRTSNPLLRRTRLRPWIPSSLASGEGGMNLSWFWCLTAGNQYRIAGPPTALHQADWEGQIAPPSNISWRCSHTSSRRGRAIHRNFSLKGSLSKSLIMCSAASMHPISFLSREKISWYSMSRRANFCASSGVQSANWSSLPSCRNDSISSFCLSSMESFFGADSGSCLSNFLVSSGVGFPSRVTLAANTRAITKDYSNGPATVPEFQVCGYHVDPYWQISQVFQIGHLSHNI